MCYQDIKISRNNRPIKFGLRILLKNKVKLNSKIDRKVLSISQQSFEEIVTNIIRESNFCLFKVAQESYVAPQIFALVLECTMTLRDMRDSYNGQRLQQ